jgi:hypothetical protein
LWGVLAMLGSRRKALALLTLIPISYVLLGHAINRWSDHDANMSGRLIVALVTTLLFVLSIAMLMRIAYAGAFTPKPVPGKDTERGLKSQNAGKAGAIPHAGKRA